MERSRQHRCVGVLRNMFSELDSPTNLVDLYKPRGASPPAWASEKPNRGARRTLHVSRTYQKLMSYLLIGS